MLNHILRQLHHPDLGHRRAQETPHVRSGQLRGHLFGPHCYRRILPAGRVYQPRCPARRDCYDIPDEHILLAELWARQLGARL